MKFNTTISLISLDKKLSQTNYPDVVYSDDDKITITDCDARIKILNNSWFSVSEINLETLLTLIVDQKHPFCPAEFKPNNQNGKGIAYTTNYNRKADRFFSKDIVPYSETYPRDKHIWRSKNSFKSIQLLCIDIDENYNSVEEIRQAITNSPLGDCSFIYSSPSFDEANNKIKVRVGWLLDEPITELKEAEFCLLNVTKYFKADDACKEVSRLYYNGKQVLYKNIDITFNKELFINGLQKGTPLTQIAQNTYSNTIYLNCAIDPKGVPTNVFTREEYKEKLTELGYTFYTDEVHNNYVIRNFDMEFSIETNSELIKFLGEHLKYSELFSLALKLNWVEGGLSFMNTIMNKNNITGISHYDVSDFGVLNSIRKYNYVPSSTYFFYDCKPKPNYYVTQINETVEPMSLKDAEKKLQEYYRTAMLAKDTDIHIIKVPTGLGKTKLIEDIEDLNVVLAFPNHMLKDEVSFRIENAEYTDITGLFDSTVKLDNKFVVTPKLPELSPSMQYKVNYLYKVGLSEEVSVLFDDVKKNPSKYELSDVEKIITYRKQLFECFKGEVNVVTTHKMTQYMEFKQKTYIYDEDPYDSIIELKTISGEDLKKLFDIFENKQDTLISKVLKRMQQNLDDALPEEIFSHIDIPNNAKKLIVNELINNNIYNSNIIDFLTCSHYYMNYDKDKKTLLIKLLKNGIKYVSRTDLPTNKKIIIFSATASELMYKQMYGERVKVYNIDNVETLGEIFQDTRYSYTRSCLKYDKMNKRGNVRNYIKKELAGKNIDSVITYKGIEYLDVYEKVNEKIYFGNAVGFDELKGKNIAIIGTPYYNDWSYVLMAKAMNANNKFNKVNFQKREIEFGNFIFKINTFEDNLLKDIHLHMTTAELIQAIGRARILRNKCNVYLFSNIPIEGAKQKYIK